MHDWLRADANTFIFYDQDIEDNKVRYSYFKDEKHKQDLADFISKYLEKNVELDYNVGVAFHGSVSDLYKGGTQ